jgi:twitching motility protein PilT
MNVIDVLKEAVSRDASDILISAGAPVSYHIFGELKPKEDGHVLTPEESEDLTYQLLNARNIREFEENWELDSSYELPGIANFRVNALKQKGAVGAVLRVVPLDIPHYTDLGISESFIKKLASIPNGLVLVTGATGAGKSSTVVSFLEYLNTEHHVAKHIVTIEDPIEFRMDSKVCIIDQREIGIDTKDYLVGLKGALRQMPHVIFVGEMRDRETIEIALMAAETGNLVVSTLATQSASKTINRIIDVFPLEDQPEVRTRLALTLRCVVSQVLLPRCDQPGRVAAREILLVNSPISNLIRENKVHQINNAIAGAAKEGMCLLDDSLLNLMMEGVVNVSDAVPRLQDPMKAQLVLG